MSETVVRVEGESTNNRQEPALRPLIQPSGNILEGDSDEGSLAWLVIRHTSYVDLFCWQSVEYDNDIECGKADIGVDAGDVGREGVPLFGSGESIGWMEDAPERHVGSVPRVWGFEKRWRFAEGGMMHW